MQYQANTGFSEGGTNTLSSMTGNWVLDGVNQVLGTISKGATIYGDVIDKKTQNEIDLLNAKAQFNKQSPEPINQTIVTDTKNLEKVMAIVGGTMIVFAASVLWFSRKK